MVLPAFFRDGFCHDIPFQFVKKSGELLDVLLSANGERDAEGKVVRSRAVIMDITERKRAEETLRQRDQLIRSILDNVDEGFAVLDRDFRIMTANKGYCQQAALDENQLIGRYCYEVTHRSDRPCHENDEACVIKQVFTTGKPGQTTHTHTDATGKVSHVETRGFPLFDAEGNLTSAIEVILDVTDRYRLEAEQRKTQKLEAIGVLAGGIAHDFNNLLQGIFGYLAMAKLSIDNKGEALAALEQAEKALTLSTKLTKQLLTFAAGGKPVKRRGDINAIIDTSASFALSGSRCDYHLHLANDLWPADFDEGQIGQVIQNIVLNAAQAMTDGGRVEITTKNIHSPATTALPAELTAGDYLEITISDNGPGIPPQHLAKIFDPYFTTKPAGSGLGLAISYSIIKKHAGQITVHSELGQGTTFTLYLPACRETHPETSLEPTVPVSLVPQAVLKSGKILFMDDDAVIRDVAGQMLTALNHQVAFAEHGEEAIALYRQALDSGQAFDAVILDLTIRGGMGGVDTLRRLLSITPTLKGVVSSGYSDDSTIAQHRDLGFAACLRKPYSLKELRETLDALL